jgi:chemotaxis protein methyltransferase CheR
MKADIGSFNWIRDFVQNEAGIVIEPGKEYLVESRLAPIARREGVETLEALVRQLKTTSGAALRRVVVDAMTTNETTFFRDIEPFEVLEKQVLPALIEARKAARTLRIW